MNNAKSKSKDIVNLLLKINAQRCLMNNEVKQLISSYRAINLLEANKVLKIDYLDALKCILFSQTVNSAFKLLMITRSIKNNFFDIDSILSFYKKIWKIIPTINPVPR